MEIDTKTDVSALGDGAPWIWDVILLEFGTVRENLDVYHGLENISQTGKVLYGEGTEECEKWREETTLELMWNGYEWIEKRLEEWNKRNSNGKNKRRYNDYGAIWKTIESDSVIGNVWPKAEPSEAAKSKEPAKT